MQDDKAVVSYPKWVWALIWTGFPALGAIAGAGLKASAGWIAGLEWAPFQGPFKLVASVPDPAATIGALAIGAVAGLVVAALSARDALKLTVTHAVAELSRGGENEHAYLRHKVTAVFLDAKHLVLLGAGGVELAREKSDLEEPAVRAAFEQYGWPWLAGGDPHAADYRRFVEDDPALPPAANALLKARAKVVAKDQADDMRELRDELAKIGVVVRDERKKQYWRQAGA